MIAEDCLVDIRTCLGMDERLGTVHIEGQPVGAVSLPDRR